MSKHQNICYYLGAWHYEYFYLPGALKKFHTVYGLCEHCPLAFLEAGMLDSSKLRLQ